MKLSTIGLTTAAVALLGVLAAPAAHAAEVPGEAKDTQTQVKIIDSPDPDPAVLKLMHVPEQYNFETKLQASGEYSLNGGVVEKMQTSRYLMIKLPKIGQLKLLLKILH